MNRSKTGLGLDRIVGQKLVESNFKELSLHLAVKQRAGKQSGQLLVDFTMTQTLRIYSFPKSFPI